MSDVLEPLAKIGSYGGLLTLVGACAARWLARTSRDASRTAADALDRRLARIGLAAAAVVLLFLFIRLWTHTAVAFGIAEAWQWDNLSIIALKSRWGGGWRWQVVTAAVCLLTSLWSARSRRADLLLLSSIAAVVLVLTFPLMGHASGSTFRLGLAAVHMLGAGIWLGTLAALLLAHHRGALFQKFSPVAFTGSAAIVATGLTMAWLYVGRPANLWTSVYGRVFALKLLLFATILACGYVNWRRARRGDEPSAATMETTLAFAVIIVTAFLTELAHP
jgi:putative copper export protein